MASGNSARQDTLLLFVYGTLMRGGCRSRHLAAQRFIDAVRTIPTYALHNLGAYPGLVRCEENGTAVEGELYEINRSLVPALDKAEGSPTLYRLEPVEIEGVAEPVFAYIYRQAVSARTLIADGRWTKAR